MVKTFMTLGKKATSGVVWVTASLGSTQIINFIASIVLARLLTPELFGQFALITVVVYFLTVFCEFGLGTAIIQTKRSDATTVNTAFTVVVVLSALFAILVGFFATEISLFFDEPTTSTPLKVMTLCILLLPLSLIPGSLLERNLDFKKRVIAEIVPTFLSSVLAVILAWLNFGIWSLVFRSVSFSLFTALMVWHATAFSPRLIIDLQIARELLRYGFHVTLASLLLYAAVNLDRLYISYYVDTETLGYYGLGLLIGNWVGNIAPIINRVMLPAFSRKQDDYSVLSAAYLKVLRLLFFILLPLSIGIFVITPRLVLIVYGEAWLPAAVFIRILVFLGLLRGFNSLIGPIFNATGQPEVLVRIIILRLITLVPLLFSLGDISGAIGVGIAGIIAMGLATAYALILASRTLGIPILSINMFGFAPSLATLIMGLGVFIASTQMSEGILSLIGLILIGILLYGGTVLLITPTNTLQETMADVRLLIIP
ncbi:MAG TPA: lipopolysaccharide biosynthesis protein [Anaerolineae bacterium]|nr:lipopolysaccharide biosynthesis protein [Anaerolineae bacterium]